MARLTADPLAGAEHLDVATRAELIVDAERARLSGRRYPVLVGLAIGIAVGLAIYGSVIALALIVKASR